MRFLYILLGLAAANQLVAPNHDYSDHGIKIKELNIFQLIAMFRSSSGITKDLPDGAFSASAQYNADHGAIYARIGVPKVSGKSHAWCGSSKPGAEITVDLTTSHVVTGVATQGRGDGSQWVTRYSVETSENGHKWENQGIFLGNFDKNTICRRRFKKPVLASFVKFKVLNFVAYGSMRVDVLVHNIGDE